MSDRHDGPMHGWFCLTYANYLVLHRSLIQEMPVRWQARLVKLLDEMREEFDDSQVTGGDYVVQVRDERGRFVTDPLAEYRRPNRDAIQAARVCSASAPSETQG